MKIPARLTWFFAPLMFVHLNAFSQSLNLPSNDFAVGLGLGFDAMLTEANGTIHNTVYSCESRFEIDPLLNGTYPTSRANAYGADGFNTAYLFQPGAWGTSSNIIESAIRLLKSNGIKSMPCAYSYFVPLSANHDDNGINVYDNTLQGKVPGMVDDPYHNSLSSNCQARPNYDLIFANAYHDADIADWIYGHYMGGEFNCLHYFNGGTSVMLPPGEGAANEPNHHLREVPPARVDEAIAHFKQQREPYPNQKISISFATHYRAINEHVMDFEWCAPSLEGTQEGVLMGCEGHYGEAIHHGPIDHQMSDYFNLSNKPDLVMEESYYPFPVNDWYLQQYSVMDPSNTTIDPVHYLGKFRNLDILQSKFPNAWMLATVGGDGRTPADPDAIQHHTNPNVKNGNWIWFQTFTSIIHGAKGVFYYIQERWTPEELSQGKEAYVMDKVAVHPDRFTESYLPDAYKNIQRPLGKQLAWLQRKNLLHQDERTILYTKTDHEDSYCIVPAYTSYIPTNFPTGYGPGGGGLPMGQLRSPNYGLRYTIRTNGNEVVMIISNPLNIPVNNVTLDFNNLNNPVIRSSTGVRVLFESATPTPSWVKHNSYKTNRTSIAVNLNTLALPTNVLMNYPSPSNKTITLSFGPMDVHILKFEASSPADHNNCWQQDWTNGGDNLIASWNLNSNDRFVPGDFDGDGGQELMIIQDIGGSNRAMLLDYQNAQWVTVWDNGGNNSISGWGISTNNKFVAGDFDGDGKDELLCIGIQANPYSWSTMFEYEGGNFQWGWSNYGSGRFIGNNAQPWVINFGDHYLVGDFNGDGKDDLMGIQTNAAIGANKFCIVNYVAQTGDWSSLAYLNNGRVSPDWMIYPENKFIVGKYVNGTKDQLLCLTQYQSNGNWANRYELIGSGMVWQNSNYGNGQLGIWSLHPTNIGVLISGNLDGDSREELMGIQTTTAYGKASTMDVVLGQFQNHWSNYGNPPYIDTWKVNDLTGGNNVRYMLIKPETSTPAMLLAMRADLCGNFLASMYRPTCSSMKTDTEAEQPENRNILVYPNPGKGTLVLRTQYFNTDGQYAVYDLQGKVVHTGIVPAGTVNTNMDLTGLTSGVYLVKFTSDNYSETTKIQIMQ